MLGFLNILSLLIITTVGISLWRKYLRQQQSSGSKYLSSVHPTPMGLIDVLTLYLAWILVPGMISAVPLAIWGFPTLDNLVTWQMNALIVVSSVAQLSVCLAAVGYLRWRYGTLDQVFGVSTLEMPNHCWIAAKAFCMVVPFVLLIQVLLAYLVPMVPYQHETIDQLRENFSLNTLLTTWFAAVVAAPICEELLFRGVLQSWLQRIHFGATTTTGFTEIIGGWDSNRDHIVVPDQPASGRVAEQPFALEANPRVSERVSQRVSRLQWWMPIVVSSTMFAAVHVGQGLAPIPLFVFGVGLGFVYRFTGSIVPSIILHFLLNAFSMFWVTLETVFFPVEVAFYR